MSPRLSSSAIEDAASSSIHGFDERLEFLRSVSSGVQREELPLRKRFEHRVEGAEGDVEVVYWPRRDGVTEAPEQLSLFLLGTPYALPMETAMLIEQETQDLSIITSPSSPIYIPFYPRLMLYYVHPT
jgi:hypothetical protein